MVRRLVASMMQRRTAQPARHVARHAAPATHAADSRTERANAPVASHIATPARKPSHFASAGPADKRPNPAWQTDGRQAKGRKKLPIPRPALIASILVVVVAAGFGGYMIWRQLTGAQAGHEKISAAIEAMGKSDESVIALNEAITDTSSSLDADALEKVASDAQDGLANLDGVTSQLDAARGYDEFFTDDDRDAIKALESSAAARRDLVDSGCKVVDLRAKALRSRASLDEALGHAVDADTEVEESVKAASEYAKSISGQNSSVKHATVPVEHDKKAAGLLQQATTALDVAKKECPSIDFSAYETYLKKKGEAIEKLTEVDQAIQKKDYEKAAKLVVEYNKLDDEAAKAAQQLPTDEDQLFSAAVEKDTKKSLDAYNKAFEKVAAADAKVREYQGVQSGEDSAA